MRLADRIARRLREGHALDIEIDRVDLRLDLSAALAPAAVLVAITDRPEPGVILTRRASHLRKHPGQVAFPGGRVDERDADEIAAALREAREEIGLAPGLVEVVGPSDRYHTFTGFDIVPIVGIIPPDLAFTPHDGEVEAVFEVPLDFLLSPANRTRKEVEFNGETRHYYEIFWGDFRIWGVTAAIVANLAKRLGHDRMAA